ncbi:MAG: GAF domain-containing protein, partial [Nocardioides sp.]
MNISPPVSENDPGDVHWVSVLITEAAADTELTGVNVELQHLCRAAARHLGLTGATVRLTGGQQDVVAASSDATAHRHAELQFDANEGPGHLALVLHRPVLVSDVQAMAARWPGLALLAAGDGLEAIFVFPLQEGAVSLGVLEVYGDRIRHLTADEVSS